MLQGEFLHLRKKLRNPFFLIHSITYWIRTFSLICIKKTDARLGTGIYNFLYYPGYLNKDLKKGGDYDWGRGYLSKLKNMSGASVIRDHGEESPEAVHAGGFDFSYNEMPDWLRQYDDHEKTFSLHRWGWLLMNAVDHPSGKIKEWGIRVMNDWFLRMNNMKDHPAWESYSVSERIVNALLFFYMLRNIESRRDEEINGIEKNLLDMAVYLNDHLEYHGNRTNNHILNNARALYMLGRLSSCQKITEIGRRILMNETPKMITSTGFLREDSSSYHLLLLRTYLEILWTAEYTGDDRFAGLIRSFTASMARAAWFFSTYDNTKRVWTIPLIGDVSPDFPVGWLSDICRSRQALELFRPSGVVEESFRGWNAIWNSGSPGSGQERKDETGGLEHQVYAESGWYRFDCGGFTIFIHVTPSGPVPLYSHGHNDIFSFVLYWKGSSLIIDPGRFSYLPTVFGSYGKSSPAHNTITIDGSESYPLNRGMYPTDYRKGNPEVQWEKREDGYYIKISHDGFKRIDNKITACREFFITKDSIRIRDRIDGKGTHGIKSYFHFGDRVLINKRSGLKLDIEETSFNFEMITPDPQPDIRLVKGQKKPCPAGWYFPEYGKALPITTCIIASSKELPYDAEYIMELPE